MSFPIGFEVGGVTGYEGGVIVPFLKVDVEVMDNYKLFVTPAMNTDRDIGVVFGVQRGF